MGRFGHFVIDADGHGGEPLGWRRRIPERHLGGILHRFPELRVGFMEAGVSWLPFWLDRVDEHWERMPEQASQIDRPPSHYFRGRCFLTTEPADRTLSWVAQSDGPMSSATRRTTTTGTASSRTR